MMSSAPSIFEAARSGKFSQMGSRTLNYLDVEVTCEKARCYVILDEAEGGVQL